jgi:hypothetical protein
MQGTISLGIYDHAGKLVRVLHREATGDEFVAALDGYITHWDGLDDNGKALPPGHYSAKGYMVGDIGIRAIPLPPLPSTPDSTPAAPPSQSPAKATMDVELTPGQPIPGMFFPDGKPFAYEDKIHVGLIGNPLDRDRAGSADIIVDRDSDGVGWLELADGLPLKRISPTKTVNMTMMGRSAPGQPLIVFLFKTQAPREEYAVTKIYNMMAFDCGGFDFPEPQN